MMTVDNELSPRHSQLEFAEVEKPLHSDAESVKEVVEVVPQLVDAVMSDEEFRLSNSPLHKGSGTFAWFHTARCNDFELISRKLGDDPSQWREVVSSRDEDNHSLLHWAALFAADDFVVASCTYVLRTGGVDALQSWTNARSKNGQTAFMWAALKGHIETMKLLYSRFNCDMYLFDSLRADAGILATQHHQHHVLLLLHKWWSMGVQNSFSRNVFDHSDGTGCSSVHWAAYKGDVLALRLLAYFGADMNLVDDQAMSPLHRAVSEGWNEAAMFLVKHCRGNVNLKNSKGESPIEIAKRLQNSALLLEIATEREKLDQDGSTASPTATMSNWILPITFCVCMGIVVVCFLTEFVGHSTSPMGVAHVLFLLCAVSSIGLFASLVTGDPGIVAKRQPGSSAIEELENKLVSNDGNNNADGNTDSSSLSTSLHRICVTCWEWKSLRTKHCSVCDVCVEGFDHHCGWLNTCVAEKNHREFVLMVGLVFVGMVAFMWATVGTYLRGTEGLTSFLFSQHLLIFPSWLIHVVILPWVGVLLFYQFRSIALNLNTNELINMHRYAHFWEGPLDAWGEEVEGGSDGTVSPHGNQCKHGHHSGSSMRKFTNPFDQGSAYRNCMYFWFKRSSSTGSKSSRGVYMKVNQEASPRGGLGDIELAEV